LHSIESFLRWNSLVSEEPEALKFMRAHRFAFPGSCVTLMELVRAGECGQGSSVLAQEVNASARKYNVSQINEAMLEIANRSAALGAAVGWLSSSGTSLQVCRRKNYLSPPP
jgi:hypothetical protein